MRTEELSVEHRKWIGDHPDLPITQIRNFFKRFHSRTLSRGVISRWCVEGSKNSPNYADKARSGHPRVADGPIRKEAKQGDTARDIATKLRERDIQVSISTTRRVLLGGRKALSWAFVKLKGS